MELMDSDLGALRAIPECGCAGTYLQAGRRCSCKWPVKFSASAIRIELPRLEAARDKGSLGCP